MEKARKTIVIQDIGEDARRQYMDASTVFEAWQAAKKQVAEVRGGMYWKRAASGEYLIRTSASNTQKSLGPRSPETEAIYQGFVGRKQQIEAREADLGRELIRHQRMNRALMVGRAPRALVDILNTLEQAGLGEHFTVVGTHALYAYEAVAGVRLAPEALATRDVDLLWDTRKRLQFVTQMRFLATSMLGLLQRVDATFEHRADQPYTAVNSKGFEVDVIRREPADDDPHPWPVTDYEGDVYAVPAKRASVLLGSPRLSAMIVSPSGHMARMQTVSPTAFAQFKRWLASAPDREPMKVSRDLLQAELVEQLVEEYLPHLAYGGR